MTEKRTEKRSVFVDDDLGFLETVKQWQKDFNLHGYVTSDIEEALNLVKKGCISIFICDLVMPRQSGISVIQKVREIDPDVELVILTGYDLDNIQKNIVKNLGGKVFLKYEGLNDLLDSLVEDAGKREPSIAIHLQARVSKLERINRAWANNLINELKEIEGLEDARVLGSENSFTVNELIDDMQILSPRGIEHIELWLDAQERLRQIRKNTK